MVAKLYPKDKERIAEVEKYEAGRRFLRRKCKRASTKSLYVYGALLFSEFLNKNLDEIVNEYKRDAKESLYAAFDKWEMIYEDFGDYLKEQFPKGTTASTYFTGSVALINANVPKSAEIRPKAPEAHPRSIPPVTIEDLTTIRNIADEREGAFVDVLKDTGMSRSDAVTLIYGQVKKAVENPNVQYHKIDVYRGKENVEYETWLGPNAIQSLRLYFKVRKQSGEKITDDTPIFAVKGRKKPVDPQSLSAIIRRLGKKTGITISPHRIRKFFETYITAGGAHPIVAKYWMGHKIRGGRSDIEAAYIIPPANVQRETYMKAYNKIDLRPQPDQLQMFLAETKARMQGMNPEERKRFIKQLAFRHKRLVDHPDIKALLEEAEGPADGGLPAQPAFKEIEESELLPHLNSGWQIVHNLQNGRVIIRKG